MSAPAVEQTVEVSQNGSAPQAPRTTYHPIDLAEHLDGNPAPGPLYLPRTDGQPLLYPGKDHLIFAEPESGKGWLLNLVVHELVEAGEHAFSADYEDDVDTFRERQAALGTDTGKLLTYAHYFRPEEPFFGNPEAIAEFESRLASFPPALVGIDGLNEALVQNGFDPDSNRDIMKWRQGIPARARQAGAATLTLDHVAKNREARGRYPIGAQAKLASVDVGLTLDVIEPFGRGQAGCVKVKVVKDRPGHLRRLADNGVIALMEVEPDGDGLRVQLAPPQGSDGTTFRPTHLMGRIVAALEENPGLSARSLRTAVAGNNEAKSLALELLIAGNHVRVERDGSAHKHYLGAVPFTEDDS